MTTGPKKVVLTVIDALKPEMLERAIAEGEAPTLERLISKGQYTDSCVSVFPSVTPVCAATIATGTTPDRHLIPSMNWYHRDEQRYVEYGSSFRASRRFGILRSMTDTVYNLNGQHLSRSTETLFETLDDAELRTVGTTYLIYRGRHLQQVSKETALSRMATATMFRKPIYGPRELFYADLFASRKTGCDSMLGLPGRRDQHAGCVGEYLVENDLFDFMLFSLPDNDTYSHKYGPDAQVESIKIADEQLARLAAPRGGIDAFLEEYAVIVIADHSHSYVNESIDLGLVLAPLGVFQPNATTVGDARVAVSPGGRSALVYVIDQSETQAVREDSLALLKEIEAVDLAIWQEYGEGVIWSERGELRFQPGDEVTDSGGLGWDLRGELSALRAHIIDGRIEQDSYPNGLSRIWNALMTPTSGDLLISAAPGFEFRDWGGSDHLGGGSHGSLHRCDSLAPLICCGIGPESLDERTLWTIGDVAPMVRRHFDLSLPEEN